jgi:lysophospholipase L1-like esterase
VWLGNSQLHSIIDEQPGDFLVSHWLKNDWPRQCCRSLELRVFSPASPSLQEQFVLSQYIVNRVPLDAMIVAIPFNDFMQDGLRDDFVFILTAELRSHLEELSVGKKVVSRAAKPLKSDPPASTISFQARADAWLSERLAAFSELWRMRPDFRAILATDVLSVRNWIFDVQPTRVRKLIKARYDLNMEALTAIVSDLHNKQIAAILYIPPLAQDHPFPYDHDEYKAFKADIMNVAHTYSATMLDLEQAVPADLWDRHAIDYMHFNGEGHKLLAKALLTFPPLLHHGQRS